MYHKKALPYILLLLFYLHNHFWLKLPAFLLGCPICRPMTELKVHSVNFISFNGAHNTTYFDVVHEQHRGPQTSRLGGNA